MSLPELLVSSSEKAKAPALRVMGSLPRSGTHWLKQLISSVTGLPHTKGRLIERPKLVEALGVSGGGNLVVDHFQYSLHADILNPAEYPSLKFVLLYRHPIDAMLSMFDKEANDGVLWDEGNSGPAKAQHLIDRLKSGDYSSDATQRPMVLKARLHDLVIDWIENRECLQVRYEDLVENTARVLRSVMDFYQHPATADAIDAAIEANSFFKLSEGRHPGEVKEGHHYRRGLPGEHNEVFDKSDQRVLREFFREELDALGYED